MNRVKKTVCLALVVLTLVAVAMPAFAITGTVTGGTLKLWKTATETVIYVAYMPNGTTVTIYGTSNNRYDCSGYGYNSQNTWGTYRGWGNTAYII